jgi:hypothetical protein
MLADGRERFTMPLEFSFDEPQELRVEVISPLFRALSRKVTE